MKNRRTVLTLTSSVLMIIGVFIGSSLIGSEKLETRTKAAEVCTSSSESTGNCNTCGGNNQGQCGIGVSDTCNCNANNTSCDSGFQPVGTYRCQPAKKSVTPQPTRLITPGTPTVLPTQGPVRGEEPVELLSSCNVYQLLISGDNFSCYGNNATTKPSASVNYSGNCSNATLSLSYDLDSGRRINVSDSYLSDTGSIQKIFQTDYNLSIDNCSASVTLQADVLDHTYATQILGSNSRIANVNNNCFEQSICNNTSTSVLPTAVTPSPSPHPCKDRERGYYWLDNNCYLCEGFEISRDQWGSVTDNSSCITGTGQIKCRTNNPLKSTDICGREGEKILCQNLARCKETVYCPDGQGGFCQYGCTEQDTGNPIGCWPLQEPNTPGVIPHSYDNNVYKQVIKYYSEGKLDSLSVSGWLSGADRIPNLQMQYCDPILGECDAVSDY